MGSNCFRVEKIGPGFNVLNSANGLNGKLLACTEYLPLKKVNVNTKINATDKLTLSN